MFNSNYNNKKKKEWYVIDAADKILGRLSSKIVRYLMGKHKIEYTPYIDIGDYVIVINSKKIVVSGDKRKKKIYYHHTGYVGGLKALNFQWMIEHHPNRVIEIAVKGMLPKGPLGRIMNRRLKVYPEFEHIHAAQTPKFLNFN